MKNKIIILLTMFIFISCSNLKNTGNTRNNEINKEYEILLNNWELEKLAVRLDSDREKINIEKYEILLQEKIVARDELFALIDTLKSNKFENIDMYFVDNFKNRKIVQELKKIDFSQMKIMTAKPKFYKDSATNTVALILRDEVYYFSVAYKWSNKEWKIMEIRDGR